MKERPILFSGPMVRALLDDTKTQTRRIWKMPKDHNWSDEKKGLVVWEGNGCEYAVDELRCPYGMVGDRLWVREAWSTCGIYDKKAPRDMAPFWLGTIRYLASGQKSGRTRASMHMPRWACRLELEIVSVRVERLNDISSADALAEGVSCHPDHHNKPSESIYSPVGGFRELWESINGADSWSSNPWVWVVEFQRA